MTPKKHTPVTLAVVFSMVAAALILAAGLAIGGSYYLSLGAIHRAAVTAAATQTQLALRAEAAQVLRTIPTCKAIVRMDEASHISEGGFPAPPHNRYDKRLSAAIHSINIGAQCPLILRDTANHVAAIKILAQLNKGQ